MKIALFHNSYRIRGGEDSMFELEVRALEASGHELAIYHVDNADRLGNHSFKSRIQTALNAPNNSTSKQRIHDFLKTHTPDISHVHNWFPIISPSIFEAHASANIPIVQTLHNYRMGCASANYRRKNKNCSLCSPGANTHAIRNRCYRGSLIGSIIWKRVMDRAWDTGTFKEMVDCYICPSSTVYQQHRAMGLPESKMKILPNACPDPLRQTRTPSPKNRRFEVVFAARLVVEKGASVLVEAWQKIIPNLRSKARLTIVGDGPELRKLKSLAANTNNIHFTGERSHLETLHIFRHSHLLVCPTLWAEPFGLTVIEAMGAGIPTIASNIGGPSGLITDHLTGIRVPPGDATALSLAIASCIQNPKNTQKMGKMARRRFEARYTEEAHARALLRTFKDVIREFHND